MRVFVFFDLPTITASDRKAYVAFRKYLIKSGFIMQQESLYTKLTLNATAACTVRENVKSHAPSKGNIQILTVTERQYATMDIVNGVGLSEYLDSTDRMVIV